MAEYAGLSVISIRTEVLLTVVEIPQLGSKETSRPDDEEIVKWRAGVTARPHDSVTFLPN